MSSDIDDLEGATSDARAMQKYLEQTLGIASKHIKMLLDQEATRAAILDSICAMKQNPGINPGDSILIFYAGYGTVAKAPGSWDIDSALIQLLAPHDILSKVDGRMINGIPDRTIGALLEELSVVKGDNITVVLDCCYNYFPTRDDTNKVNSRRSVRCFEMPQDVQLPSDLDQDIWQGHQGLHTSPGFLKSGLSSHVLLTACGPMESAQEHNGRGYFTRALLDTFSTFGVHEATYTGIIRRLPCLPGYALPFCPDDQ